MKVLSLDPFEPSMKLRAIANSKKMKWKNNKRKKAHTFEVVGEKTR